MENISNEEDTNMEVSQEDEQESPLQGNSKVHFSCLKTDPNHHDSLQDKLLKSNSNIVIEVDEDKEKDKNKNNLESKSFQSVNVSGLPDSASEDPTNSILSLAGTGCSVEPKGVSQLGQSSISSQSPGSYPPGELIQIHQTCLEHNLSKNEASKEISPASSSSNSSLQFSRSNFSLPSPPSMDMELKQLRNNDFHHASDKDNNSTVSDSFLSANSVANRPMLHAAKSGVKSFAQAAAPPAVAGSIPNRGSSPECGLLVERLKGTLLDDYAKAIEEVAGKRTLVFIGQGPEEPEYVMAFLERPELVNKVVAIGISIKKRWLCVTHICQPATKLIISDALPFISDNVIINGCKPFGDPVYENLRRVPSSVRAQEYKHLLSFRRELLIVLRKGVQVPEYIDVFSHGRMYRLRITSPGLICFNCKLHGHRASACRSPRSTEMRQETFGIHQADKISTQSQVPNNASTSTAIATSIPKIDRALTPTVLNSTKFNNNDKNKKDVSISPDPELQVSFDSLLNNLALPLPSMHTNATKDSPAAIPSDNPKKKGTWQTVGKKGRAVPLVKTTQPSAQESKKKTHKTEKCSDVTALRKFESHKDDPHSPEGSIADDTPESTESSKSNKRKKKVTKEKIHTQPTLVAPKPQEPVTVVANNSRILPHNDPPEQRCIQQLKKILSEHYLQQQLLGNKVKIPRKEVDSALLVVEELLQSIWSLRAARRQNALAKLKEKHSQLFKQIEVVLSAIPPTMHTNQAFRSLNGIRQDLIALESNDSRKSRILRT